MLAVAAAGPAVVAAGSVAVSNRLAADGGKS